MLTISFFLGIYRKPFLLALPTLLVKLGEKVTLKCLSEITFDTFTLTSHRMGINKNSHQLSAEIHMGVSHANFPIGPVTPDHAGTYTCYGSYNETPYEWSESSDPVDIKITGKRVLPGHQLLCIVEQLFYRQHVLEGDCKKLRKGQTWKLYC